jgi:hypothetical protein
MHPCEPWKPQGENTKISQNLPYNKRRRSYHTINRGSHVLAKNQSGSEVHLERNCDRSVAEEVLLGEPLLSDWVRRHRFLCRCPPDLGVAFASRMAGRKRTMTDGCGEREQERKGGEALANGSRGKKRNEDSNNDP